MIRVTSDDFGLDELVETVRGPRIGAIVVFLGTVRSVSNGRQVSGLFLESYREMAEKQLVSIVEEARKRFGILDASIIHRVGSLPIGSNILGIAVGAEHREEAYKASKFIIDELKKGAAIWKKEIGENGEVWVEEDARSAHDG